MSTSNNPLRTAMPNSVMKPINEAIEFFPGRVKRDQWVTQAKILLGEDVKLDEKALKQTEEMLVRAEASSVESKRRVSQLEEEQGKCRCVALASAPQTSWGPVAGAPAQAGQGASATRGSAARWWVAGHGTSLCTARPPLPRCACWR